MIKYALYALVLFLTIGITIARETLGQLGLDSSYLLMAVLALAKRGSVVICNGYKDREYIRLALIGRRLGLEIFIVIEKPSELRYVIEEAKALGKLTVLSVAPLLGEAIKRIHNSDSVSSLFV